MSAGSILRDVLWFFEDYKAMVHVLQETAYRLTEVREGWGLTIGEMAHTSGLEADVLTMFEELGAASVGARTKGGEIAKRDSDKAAQPPGMAGRIKQYQMMAVLVQELASQLKAMPEGWGMLTEVIRRASGVSLRLAEQIEIVGAMRLRELLKKNPKARRRPKAEAA